MTDVPDRTDAEKDASVVKLLAEAEQAKAAAEQAKAEAAAKRADARFNVARAVKAELETAALKDSDRARRASDDFHHVYRFDGEVSAQSVKACITKLTEWRRLKPGCEIEVIFSSPGGSIFDGMELFDFLVDLGQYGAVTTGGAGMAASMAGILVQAGTRRYVTRECWFLIHRAAFLAMGKTYEIEDRVDLIKRIEDRIISIFTDRSTLTARKIRRNWERKDWWLSSDECLEWGLVDEVRGTPGAPDVPEFVFTHDV